MKIYAVGGCVRDQLLGRPVADRDWVVVGATPGEMVAAGYRPSFAAGSIAAGGTFDRVSECSTR